MKNVVYSVAVIVLCTLAGMSQQPQQKPTADENSVVKVSTDLIQLDVTVTDRNGKVVTGLAMPDFEVYENGEKQKVSNLSFVSRTSRGASVSGGAANDAGSDAPAGPLAPQIRRTIAIVVDDLNLSFASVYYTRRALRKFVDTQMQPNDMVAIIRTGGSVGALQQFTSDKRLLYAAIERIRWNPLGNGNIDALSSVGQDAKETTERFATESDHVAAIAGQDSSGRKTILTRPNITDVKATDYNQSRQMDDLVAGLYAQAALGTIKYIVSGMSELPGRKMMMLFSDGFAIRSDANKSRSSMVYQYLQELVDYTNRSSVVVYTFDTRGLQSLNTTNASDSTYEVIDGHREQKQLVRLNDFRSNQDGLVYYAGQTGGKALLNSNDLNGGIQRALDEQTGYYLIGYVPDAEAFDPAKRRFNKIEVKVTRPGMSVSYRSGFFNSNSGDAVNSNLTVETKMVKALTSPFTLSEITLSMNALYADDPNDGAYIRSFLHTDAKGLKFSEDADGWKKATFEVSAVTFGDNGAAIENTTSQYTIKTKGATYDAMLQKGFVYVLIMPVKKPGVYQYRVALRDAETGKIGSASQVVEIPDLTKNRLEISSMAVEGVSPTIWQNISQGKVGNNSGQTHVASTLLYDTVLRQFAPNTVLRYGYEVYNAKLDDSSRPHLETQIRILQNNRTVVEGNPAKFDASSQADPKHIRISGAVMLKDTLESGDYVLQVTVNDIAGKRKAVQLFPFEIVK